MSRNIFEDTQTISMHAYSREEFEDQVAQSVITGLCMLYRMMGSELAVRRIMKRNVDAVMERIAKQAT